MLWLIQIFSLINDLFWVAYHFFRDTRILMCDGYVCKNDAVCRKGGAWSAALQLHVRMQEDGVERNATASAKAEAPNNWTGLHP